MIRAEDLQEAIAECEGQRNPNANTCIKLAAYHILMDHLEPKIPTYSSKGAESITYDSGSEFSKAIMGMQVDDFVPVMDELMDALKVLNPKLHDSVIRKLKGWV